MDIAAFHLLLTPIGQETLHAAIQLIPREENFLRDFTNLQKKYPVELARTALEIAILRNEAARKFSNPERMYFTRPAFEQASPEEVSIYRSQRYRSCKMIIDLGCSVGCDTLALAHHAPTLGFDLDPLRLTMAQANAATMGVTSQTDFIQTDLTVSCPCASRSAALFFDPSRRSKHRRVFSVSDYTPPLKIIQQWLLDFPALGVKISPGVRLTELDGYDCEIEFISLRGDLKEATLWFGPLKTTQHRATILPGPHTLTQTVKAYRGPKIQEPQTFLYEPDAAILRAGLVKDLAEILEAAQLDPDIAYLTSNKKLPTPFARLWAIQDWFPFQLKRLRAYLRERNIGQVTVKKRGSPLTPEALIRDLRLSGSESCTLFLTHLRGAPIVIIAANASDD